MMLIVFIFSFIAATVMIVYIINFSLQQSKSLHDMVQASNTNDVTVLRMTDEKNTG